ncbi:28S rRNA cytosine-C 5 methyltransferase [Taenia crassiceps]|uniref:tRNA (guanine(9)-N(1))-methyltransferase n=1 Tax=Taenia crassiceps TaxID=6207 RepID=A0ABR4Q563_9CEST
MDKVIETLGSSSGTSFFQVSYDREKTSYKKYIKLARNLKMHQFVQDYHFPSFILLLPPGTDLHLSPVITSDMAVIQDKASCIPPLVLLDVLELPRSQPLKILDACAAPGNKTTLILSGLKQLSQKGCLMALDWDKRRFQQLCDNLRRMHDGVLKVNGVIEGRKVGTKASEGVICEAFSRDFLTVDPVNEEKFAGVTAILVDPTCSASGLRCKRPELAAQEQENETRRVEKLASLQAKILRHALSFPSVEVVIYSTCSVYQQENEAVVRELVESGAASDFELVAIWDKSKSKGKKETGKGTTAVPNPFTPLGPWKMRGFVEDDSDDTSKMMASGSVPVYPLMNEQTGVAGEIPSSGTLPEEVNKVDKPVKLPSFEVIESNTCEGVEPPQKKRKLSKKERYLQRKEQRRDKRKALKARRRARRDAAAAVGEALPRVPPQPPRVSMAESKCRTCVVLDCAYDHLMSLKDTCKLAHQIAHCYSTNRHLPAPVQLYITGLGSAFKTQEGAELSTELREPLEESTLARLRKADAQNWDVYLKMEDYRELFPASSIVYLCAESEYELPDTFLPASTCTDAAVGAPTNNSAATLVENTSSTTDATVPVFTTDDVYVIGGLVDHNHHQGLCYQQALLRGHRTARLPLERAGVKVEGRRVLALLHVFQALAFVLSGAHLQWHDALRAALPPRKCNPQ